MRKSHQTAKISVFKNESLISFGRFECAPFLRWFNAPTLRAIREGDAAAASAAPAAQSRTFNVRRFALLHECQCCHQTSQAGARQLLSLLQQNKPSLSRNKAEDSFSG